MTPVPFFAENTAAATSEDSGERTVPASKYTVEAVVHVDLSVTTNVELLSRLAPLMQELKLNKLSESHSRSDSHGVSSLGSPASPYPEIDLRLTYHIFNMQAGPNSARHCLTGDAGQFCAFPPADVLLVEESLGGSVVVEESLLQLCLAEYLKNGSQALVLTDAGEGEARPRNSSEVVFWRYLQGWCRHCSHIKVPSIQARGVANEEETGTGDLKNYTIPSDTVAESRFQRVCSQKLLASLNVSLSTIAEACGDVAESLLERQVDSVFPVVPTLVINGQIARGEITAESTVKSLCEFARQQHRVVSEEDFLGPPLCYSPRINSSPSLVFDELTSASGNGSFAVAEHLLKTYGQTEKGREGRSAANVDGTYRLKNELAAEILRRQEKERQSRRSTLPKSTLPVGEAASAEIGEQRSATEYNKIGFAPPRGADDGIGSPSQEAISAGSGGNTESKISYLLASSNMGEADLKNDLLLFSNTSWYEFPFGFWLILVTLFFIFVLVSVLRTKRKRRLLQRRGDVAAGHEE